MSDAWVYVLRCRDGSLYGWTSDLDRRMARHDLGHVQTRELREALLGQATLLA